MNFCEYRNWKLRLNGTPRPKGSWTAYRGNFVKPKTLAQMEESYLWQIRASKPPMLNPIECAVEVEADFLFRWPTRAAKRDRTDGAYKNSTPDLDKLIRALLDVLVQGRVIADDRQVVNVSASKSWTWNEPGTDVWVATVDNFWPACEVHDE